MEIIAQQMVTDLPSSFQHDFLDLSGYHMAQKAAQDCYKQAQLTADNVDVLEVHDCFSANEVCTYCMCGYSVLSIKIGCVTSLLR